MKSLKCYLSSNKEENIFSACFIICQETFLKNKTHLPSGLQNRKSIHWEMLNPNE